MQCDDGSSKDRVDDQLKWLRSDGQFYDLAGKNGINWKLITL